MITKEQLRIRSLGGRRIPSPLRMSSSPGDGVGNFIADHTGMRFRVEYRPEEDHLDDLVFEKAGPREHIFFEPEKCRAAMVTCGGLCPGLNNVIRSLFFELHHNYGVRDVLGIRYGYSGLNPEFGVPPVRITHEMVDTIHRQGGTILGSSRGSVPAKVMVDTLEREGINMIFCIGGDGTQRGAHDLCEEIQRRDLRIAVVGIPKTIDNDISFVWRSFGYYTALDESRRIIESAHAESKGTPNGISLVKLMGRHAGFIAAGATLASQEVNFTLIPEVPFSLDGGKGFLAALKQRILSRSHAVIVLAEGAGQDLMGGLAGERDRSGNKKPQDIGLFLRNRIENFFEAEKIQISLKYFDPSYIIRSVPANSDDALLCNSMARYAVHAAMAGKTDMLIGLWYNVCIHVPIDLAVARKKRVSPESSLWTSVLAATGQPIRFS